MLFNFLVTREEQHLKVRWNELILGGKIHNLDLTAKPFALKGLTIRDITSTINNKIQAQNIKARTSE